ncbi:MAG: restriction endonuclease [Candidatus Aminicenantes bacterium]|nr:restriction endonuclease [Candidatus Aminicenantes bacterium]
MAIPDYQAVMLPLLKFLGDGEVHSKREAVDYLSEEFKLTDQERKELLPSGQQPIFGNRVGWARTFLKKAGLIKSIRHGYFAITDRGRQVLSQTPQKINVKFLEQFPEFIEFKKTKKVKGKKETPPPAETNPEETLETAYQELQESLTSELMQTIRECSPEFFERLVIDVLITMGYGGSRKEAGEAIGRTGDGGIDGIIKEDKLGLDIIYIQAKRWDNTVGRPEIQKFAGALQGQKAKKGIFITTSTFTQDALDYINKIDNKIILIDGERLAELMIEHNVGVTPVAAYEVKKIDSDYFIED